MEHTQIKARSLGELRDVLFDELDALRSGRISPHRARATAALSFQILDSVRVEILYRVNALPGGSHAANDSMRGLPTPKQAEAHD